MITVHTCQSFQALLKTKLRRSPNCSDDAKNRRKPRTTNYHRPLQYRVRSREKCPKLHTHRHPIYITDTPADITADIYAQIATDRVITAWRFPTSQERHLCIHSQIHTYIPRYIHTYILAHTYINSYIQQHCNNFSDFFNTNQEHAK